jgi:hypothetical protein
MTKTEQAWRSRALKTMAHAADVLEEYERQLATLTSQANAYRRTRPLTPRLLHHWTGAASVLTQFKRHLPSHHGRALKRLRELVPKRAVDAERI